MSNVMRQDELMNKMKDAHGGILLKEMALKKQQEDIKGLGSLNKYNNDMVQMAYKSQRNALTNYKNGSSKEDDPFLNFLKDPAIFQNPGRSLNNQSSDPHNQNDAIDELNTLDRLSRALVQPHGPASGMEQLIPEEEPQIMEENVQNEPFSAMAQIDPQTVALRPNSKISPLIKKDSIKSQNLNSPGIKKNPSMPFVNNIPNQPPNYIPNQPLNYQIPPQYLPSYQSPQYQPSYQSPPPIVNVIPMPYPSEKRSSNSSSRGNKKNKIPEEVKMMISKQNELLQNFIEKVEKNGTLETKEDYSEKYEQKIRELEKNFDLSQEILNLKKQLYTFNNEKSNKEEKKPGELLLKKNYFKFILKKILNLFCK